MTNERTYLGVAGLVLVVGFFLPWIDVGGVLGLSGWDLVRDPHMLDPATRVILALCPVLGGALALAAFSRSPRAGTLARIAGAGVLGYTSFKVAYVFVKITGWGLWLVLAAACFALIGGLAARRE